MAQPTRPVTLADRIATLREAVFGPRGLAAFGRAIGVSAGTVQKWERGTSPSAAYLAAIAAQTGCDAKWLLSGSGRAFPPGAEVRRKVDGLLIVDSPSLHEFPAASAHASDILVIDGHVPALGTAEPGVSGLAVIECKRAVLAEDGAFTLEAEPSENVALPLRLAGPQPKGLTGIVWDLDVLDPLIPAPAILVANCMRAITMVDSAAGVLPDRKRLAIARVRGPKERKPSRLFAGLLSVTGRSPILVPPNARYSPRTIRGSDIAGYIIAAVLDLRPNPA